MKIHLHTLFVLIASLSPLCSDAGFLSPEGKQKRAAQLEAMSELGFSESRFLPLKNGGSLSSVGVSQLQFTLVTGYNPSKFRALSHCPEEHKTIGNQGVCPSFPVENVMFMGSNDEKNSTSFFLDTLNTMMSDVGSDLRYRLPTDDEYMQYAELNPEEKKNRLLYSIDRTSFKARTPDEEIVRIPLRLQQLPSNSKGFFYSSVFEWTSKRIEPGLSRVLLGTSFNALPSVFLNAMGFRPDFFSSETGFRVVQYHLLETEGSRELDPVWSSVPLSPKTKLYLKIATGSVVYDVFRKRARSSDLKQERQELTQKYEQEGDTTGGSAETSFSTEVPPKSDVPPPSLKKPPTRQETDELGSA